MKNIHVFTAELPSLLTLQSEIQSNGKIFEPCDEHDFKSFGYASDNCVVSLANGYRIDFIYEEKLLPASAIKNEVNKRVKKVERLEGGTLANEHIAIIREDVMLGMVKRALTVPTYFSAFYHTNTKSLIIDVTKSDLAQMAVSTLCHTLKSLKTETLHVSEVSNSLPENIKECMNNNGSLGFANFSYGDKLHLKNSDGESVKFDCVYELDHVYELLTNGYSVERVCLLRDDISFDLTRDFKIKSIKSSLVHDDELTKQEMELAEQQAQLEIMSSNVIELVEFFNKSNELDKVA